MAIPRTSLLDLPLPVTGSLSGDWGAATNNGLTEYLDIAVAGSLVLNTDADVTLTSTDGDENGTNIGSTTAQYAILRWTATGSTTRNITVPAKSKTYIVINATGGTQSIVLRGAGPTTGVTIVSGEKAVCAWNGSDFVKVGGAAGGTNTQVQFNDNGVFGGSANLTWDGSTLATTGLTASGAVTLSATTQNIALGTSQVGGTWTAGGASQTGAITLDQSTKTHTLNIGTGATENALTKTINLGTAGVSGSTTAINIGSAVSGATTNVTLNGTVQPGVVISGSSSGDALRITQTGTGNALLVEDSTNPDSSPFVVDASGNVGIGTSSPQSLLNTASTGQVQIGTSSWPTNFIGKSNARTIIGNEGVLLLWNEAAATAGNEAALYIGPKGSGTNGSTIIAGGYVKGISESSSTNNGALTFGTNSGGGNSEKMRLDSSGNLGLGVTPSAWGSIFKASQIGNYGAFVAGRSDSANQLHLGTNSYYNGTNWIYANTSSATRYVQASGAHEFYTAPSGTAGATTSITSGQVYTVTTLGSTTLVQWQAYFSALSSIPSVGQSITATATGTLAGGATVTQTITFTQAMTLDASGNLGIGVTSITNKLTSATSSANTFDFAQGTLNGGTNAPLVQFEVSNSNSSITGATAGIVITAGGSGAAQYGLFVERTGATTGNFIIRSRNSNEVMRITSGGDLLVGTTTVKTADSSYKNITIDGSFTAGPNLGAFTPDATLNIKEFGGTSISFFYGTTKVGSITNTASATAYNTSSDYRLKDNPQPLTGSGAFIDALQPKTWNWKADGSRGVGFIAHEVQEVSPGSVVGKKDGEQMQAMEYGSAEFIANIIAELQSLRQRVAALEGTQP
jgi:hypothetical protein